MNEHTKDCNWTNADCEYVITHYYCPHPEHACNCKEPRHTHHWQPLGGDSPWSHCTGCDKWKFIGRLEEATPPRINNNE